MSRHPIHGNHSHIHGDGCGHTAIRHDGHVDYLHDGCMHRLHGDHFDECRIEDSEQNPSACAPRADCHTHGEGCGHESVPHGDHVDYLVDGRLHHPHQGHCDDHGPVEVLR